MSVGTSYDHLIDTSHTCFPCLRQHQHPSPTPTHRFPCRCPDIWACWAQEMPHWHGPLPYLPEHQCSRTVPPPMLSPSVGAPPLSVSALSWLILNTCYTTSFTLFFRSDGQVLGTAAVG